MLQVNIEQLVAAVKEAAPFALPEMNEGESYLYNNLYGRLSRGEVVCLSELDFDAFASEDIGSICNLYNDVLGKSSYQVDNIMKTLRRIAPVCKAATYV